MSGPPANPEAFRAVSNALDKVVGNDSQVRHVVHTAWHTGAYALTGNPAEAARANQQAAKVSPEIKQGFKNLMETEKWGGGFR